MTIQKLALYVTVREPKPFEDVQPDVDYVIEPCALLEELMKARPEALWEQELEDFVRGEGSLDKLDRVEVKLSPTLLYA